MTTRPSEALLDEAAEWIAAQMAEEGVMVGGGLVDVLLALEWDALEAGHDPTPRSAMVETICERLNADGVRVGPLPPPSAPPNAAPNPDNAGPHGEPVPPSIVEHVLSWEDDFLALAGISRTD